MSLKRLLKLIYFRRCLLANSLFLLFYKESFLNRILESLVIVFRILDLLFSNKLLGMICK